MVNYDYAIIGGGPTGLTLAYKLMKKNYNIILIEKEKELGGCWKVEWENNKYFTEHSPRVLIDDGSSDFFNLMKEINYDYKNNLVYTYGNSKDTFHKIFNFFNKKFSFFDIIKIFFAKIIGTNNYTVEEWYNKKNISDNGKIALRVLSILMANTPKKLLMSEILSMIKISFNKTNIYQFKDNMEWIYFIEKKLDKITIIKDNSVKEIITNNGNVNKIILNDNREILSKEYILSLPPLALSELLKKSNIHNNFINNMEKWTQNSYYISLGFQIHFKYNPPNIYNYQWCFSCTNDYNLIILPTSKYATQFTKDNDIKEVWSCTIVDTDKYIERLGKTINQMSKDEIKNDILELLDIDKNNVIVTFYDGTQNINGKWYSKDSAFSVGKSGILPMKGTIENLYNVGPQNFVGITTINKAVESANRFIKYKFSNNYMIIKKISIILILLTFIFSFIDKISNVKSLYDKIVNKNMPFPFIATAFAIISQGLGIIILLLTAFDFIDDSKIIIFGKTLLIVFTLLATYYYHNIFTMKNQKFNFLKNLGLIGGISII
jgi:putative oxidoreductase